MLAERFGLIKVIADIVNESALGGLFGPTRLETWLLY